MMKKTNQPAAGVIRSLFMLLCALMCITSAKAQSGLSCTDAIPLPDDFINIPQTSTEHWITFTTGTDTIPESAFGIRVNNTNSGYIETLELYSGDCSSLTLVTSKNRMPGDSVIVDTVNMLLPNTVYYFKTVRTCMPCDDTVFFEFASRTVAGAFGYTLDPGGSNPQNYACPSLFNDCHITICQFGTIQFSVANSPINPLAESRWRRNSTTIVNCLVQNSITLTFNFSGTSTVSCSQLNCPQIGINSMNFIVHVVSPLTVAVNPATSSICPGQSITLTAANIPSGQSVQWSTGQNGVTSITVTPPVTSTYTANIITCPTTTATVTVLPIPVANAGNDVTICNGQSTTLTGTSNLNGTYIWSVLNGAPVCLGCNTITVSPSVTTSYVFAAQHPNNGCYDRDTVTVTVLSSPTANAGSDLTTCLGQTVTLMGTVGGTYDQTNWSTNLTSLCNGCTSISFTPAQGTQYAILTATNSSTGCTVTDTVLINITQLTGVSIVPVLGVNANILCANVAYTVTGAPAGSQYFWGHTSTPSVTGAVTGVGQYTVNWSSANLTSANVTCTVVAPDGCTAILSLPVTTTCCTSSGSETPIVLNNASSANLISAVQGVCPTCVSGNIITCPPTTPVHINGTFTVNQSLVLVNFIDLRMGTNAAVNILPGNALELRNCTTSLYCPYMWDGIYINGTTATLKTTTNTLLQQARNAVVSVNGGVFAVENTTLRNCVKGIVVQPYSAANHIGLVRSTVFDMPGTFLPALPALPTTTTKTLVGIEINNVSNITIGDAAQTSYKNKFNGLFKGVYAKASGTTIRNAEFTNIIASNQITMSGTAVHCEGQKGVPYTQFINVGGTLSNQPCKFDNIRRGIAVSLAHNVNVTGNSFTNFTNWFSAPAVGISVTNCIGRTVNIANNRISNFNTANRLPNGITITDVSGSTVSITNNRLLQCSSTASSYGEQVGTGIAVQNTTAVPVALTVLNNDTISRFAYGITLTNISNTAQALVKSNRVLFAKPKTNYNAQLHYGIGLINCTQIKADSNRVQRTTTGVWQSSDAATLATNLRGVYVTNSSGCMVSQNTFTGLGEGVHANSTCPATFFVCNSFNQSYRACMFTGANSSNAAYLNDQLNFQSTIYPTGNVFVGSATSDLSGAIRLVTNINNPINWYYSGTIPSIGNLQANSLTNNAPTLTNNSSPCNLTPFLMAQGGDQRDMLAGSQISVSEDVQTTDMNKELATKDAHLLLLQNPDWLNLNTPEDADYQQFFAATDTTEIGKTNHTEQAALVDDTLQAIQLNSVLVGTTDLTATHKTVFEIYNRSWLLDNIALSGADTAVLLPIALQQPAQGGEAVYTARVMLGITVDDATGNYSYRFAEPETIPVITADVFPNPATTQVTVKGNFNETDVLTFTLFDLSGRVVTNQQLPAGNSTINVDLSTLQPGAYLYQITVNGVMVQSERLVIAR